MASVGFTAVKYGEKHSNWLTQQGYNRPIHACIYLEQPVAVHLPQVDLINFGVEYVRPQSCRWLGREAAERATKSREVDLRPAGTE